jgi:FkbM family methyltransferase
MHLDARKKKFRAVSNGYELWFYHEGQAYYACKRGIVRRAQILADAYFLPLIPFAPGDVVVDCGANVGELKLCFLEMGVPVEYIGIEPAPLEYECLRENVAPSRTLNVALWDSDGELEFFLSSQMADSSLIEPPQYDQIIKVPARRLDGLLPNQRIKLLKVEAEGAEPEVLAGAENILAQIEYISADVGFERGKAQTNTMGPVTNYLLARGFELLDVGQHRLIALYRNVTLARSSSTRSPFEAPDCPLLIGRSNGTAQPKTGIGR